MLYSWITITKQTISILNLKGGPWKLTKPNAISTNYDYKKQQQPLYQLTGKMHKKRLLYSLFRTGILRTKRWVKNWFIAN